jgi:hypothetical protein
VIILDLDNCVADDGWRIPRVNWRARDNFERYHPYHALAPWDAVANEWTYSGREAVVMTSRPVAYREATEEWMRRALIRCRHLLMRNNADHRPSLAVKRDQLNALYHYGIDPERDIEMAYDDRADIIAMYVAQGIKATRVAIHNLTANWEDRPNEIRKLA